MQSARMLLIEVIYWSGAVLFCWKIFLPFMHMNFMFTVGKKIYSKRQQLKTAGDWAIVTGATAGIGEVYARELAKDGLNILLMSNDEGGLKRVSEDLMAEFCVKTKMVTCDFTHTDIYRMLEQEINKLPSIACLVNNVGICYPYPARFADANFMDSDFIRNLINCNMNAMINLTRIVLPRLLNQNTTGSAIINLSSFAGTIPYPYLSFYGASKAFIQHFVKALNAELKDSKVIIQAVCPLRVATATLGISNPSFFIPTAEQYVLSALDMLGVEAVTIGYFPHALKAFIISLFPKFAVWAAEGAYNKIRNIKEQ